jgi:outer membrane protein, heavy metal efflux system
MAPSCFLGASMRFFWVVCCIVLSGCAAYQPKPLDAARLAARFDMRSLSDPALRAYIEHESGRTPPIWPTVRWNRQMLTLAAGFYSPALAVARAQQQATQGGMETAEARPNPVLDFPFEYQLNHQGEGKPYTTGPALIWTIETGGKRAARIDQATATAEVARLNLLGVAWQVRSQVRAALLGVFAQTRRSALLAEKTGYLQRSVELLGHRLLAGAVALPDVRRARLQLAQAQSELGAAQVALADARTRLATVIGIPVAALEGVQFDFSEFEHAVAIPAPADARRAAIRQRADLHGALAEYEASQAALRLEIARQYPDAQLGTGYSYDVGANKLSFGLAGVSLPVFDRNRGAIAQAEARRMELAARAEAVQATILNELDNSLARYRASKDALERGTRDAAVAARQRDSVDASFAAGASDRLERTQALVDFESFSLEYLNAVVAQQEAAGLLEDAMQQVLPSAPASLHIDPSPSAP